MCQSTAIIRLDDCAVMPIVSDVSQLTDWCHLPRRLRAVLEAEVVLVGMHMQGTVF